jgi:hypothetical protein
MLGLLRHFNEDAGATRLRKGRTRFSRGAAKK